MTIDSWAYASRWRNVHPAEKALFSATCMIASVLSHSPLVPAVVAGCCVALAVLSAGIPAKQFARSMLIPGFFPLWSCVALTVSLPTSSAVLPAGLVYRQVFVFLDTLSQVRTAQAARLGCADVGKARRSLGVAGGHLFASTFQQAQHVTQGLLARGYEGSLRCLPADYRFVPLNLAMGGGAGALFIAAEIPCSPNLEHWGHAIERER